MKRVIAAAAIVMVALPAQAHTPDEMRTWEADWVTRVKSTGLTLDLLAERREWDLRHAIQYEPSDSTTSSTGWQPPTQRNMGQNVEQWRPLVAGHFPPDQVNTTLCVMKYESGGNPNAKNPASSARGLMQILASLWAPEYGLSYDDLYSPEINLYVARQVWNQQGWRAWSVYNRGLC